MTVILSGSDYDSNYRLDLARMYNDTQGDTNEYLDKLHSDFLCCGTTGMQLNVTGDPNLFEPTPNMLTRLPKSCCSVLDEDGQCNSENIHKVTCDVPHDFKVLVFRFFTVPLLVITLVWKIIFHVLYNRSDSLFAELAKNDRIQMVKPHA